VTSSRHSPATSLHASEPVRPFLKWPGGKRWAAARISALVRPALSGTYYEPFLGGGALFFSLLPNKAVLGDLNAELIDTYLAVRDCSREVLVALRKLRVSADDYYRVRASTPRTQVGRAARFLYLNRTAFGGIFRLNRDGQFNVPYGGGERTPAILWETDLLQRAALALKSASLRSGDFEDTIANVGEGDVVYCDPTYTVAHDNNGFRRYNEHNFTWADQERLAEAARHAAKRGATVLVSNAHHESVRRLYPTGRVLTFERASRVSAIPSKRRTVSEYVFLLSPFPTRVRE
jgi:DNA adenine methylase